MSIKFKWDEQLYTCRFFGDVLACHIFTAMKGFYNDSRSGSARGIIVDLSSVNSMVSELPLLEDVITIDRKNSLIIEDIRFAFIRGNEHAQAFIDQYLELSARVHWHYQCFDDEQSAQAWITAPR